jgi:hypothetical protein
VKARIAVVFERAQFGELVLVFEGLNFLIRTVRKIGQGIVSDLAVGAVGVSRQHSAIRLAVTPVGGVINEHSNGYYGEEIIVIQISLTYI